tara:strand:+ start:324 stop:509 length:186 start_codon:yes stop_codon:yes gene_type:complete
MKNEILLDALHIYNNCISVRDAQQLMRSNFWLNQPVNYKQSVWNKLIDLCETYGYFEEVQR